MIRPGDTLNPGTGLYWNIHLRRVALRVMLQAAVKQGKRLNSPDSWEAMENGYPSVLRAFADAMAESICRETDPAEHAKLEQIPRTEKRRASMAGAIVEKDVPRRGYGKDRAVFLSRYFPVPPPDEWSTATFDIPQMRMLGRKLCTAVDIESDLRPEWPDGWRESYSILRGGERI